MVQQGSVAQPRKEVVTIGGCEHIRKGILGLAASLTIRDGQEMEIVVAQYRDGTVPQCLDKPQYLQRLRATVHEITSKPELVACAIKMQTVEQCEQGGKTALHISNSINSHPCLSGQCACVHSGSRSLDCVSCLYLYCTPGGCLGYRLIPRPMICLKIGNVADILALAPRDTPARAFWCCLLEALEHGLRRRRTAPLGLDKPWLGIDSPVSHTLH